MGEPFTSETPYSRNNLETLLDPQLFVPQHNGYHAYKIYHAHSPETFIITTTEGEHIHPGIYTITLKENQFSLQEKDKSADTLIYLYQSILSIRIEERD